MSSALVRSSSPSSTPAPEADPATLLERQRRAYIEEGAVSARTRIDRLDRAVALLKSHQERFCEAVAADFGGRPAGITLMMDVYPAVQALRHARRHVGRWMRPRRVSTGMPLGVPGANSELRYQPLGVVGIISPWNFPVALTFGPLAGALSAGNRCLIKPSEVTAATTSLIAEAVCRYFDPSEVTVVSGGTEVAASFSHLPFDHLVFTGSTEVGRRVMSAAAENLVPLTLELGGKCPVIIGRSANLARAVDRILLGKLANAGQVCLAPDHVYVPRELLQSFTEIARSWVERVYPAWAVNPDYTSIITPRHASRVQELIADAVAKGGRTVMLGGGGEPSQHDERRVPPMLILDPTDDMRIMREEIFAPVLPLLPYERIEEVIADVNRRARPLALYYFGHDRRELRDILGRTVSGGLTVNDIAAHFLVQDLPFGGVGASGMGAYHGEQGFRQFSHARAVFRQTRLDLAGLIGLRPPYGARLRWALRMLIGR